MPAYVVVLEARASFFSLTINFPDSEKEKICYVSGVTDMFLSNHTRAHQCFISIIQFTQLRGNIYLGRNMLKN